ncbi:MAG: YceI family protein, partial [Flammeovirgaceae bacterium]|nr:YceI family protein [Flammeovirgaceae bacterium]
MRKLNVWLAAMFISGAAIAQTTWTIDKSHSNITFTATHMVVAEVEGNFKDFDAKVTSSSEDFNGADVEFTAKTASIFTDSENRDKHLKSDDFFNAEQFPEIKFAGKIVKEGAKYKLNGQFTMRDVTKDVVFDVNYRGSINTGRGTKAGFKITGTINRFDYGLKWNRAM